MRENFSKIKKKYTLHAAIKSAVGGVAIGLLVAGALLLAFKLTGIPFAAGYYVLVGFGAALLFGAALFLVLRPSALRVAKRLDSEYALEERAQTLLEFEGQEGTIVVMQREDTEERLASLPKPGKAKAIRSVLSRCWVLIVLAVLAPALLLTAAFIPAKAVDVEKENPLNNPFLVSEYQLVAVQELINDVKKSELETELKDSTVSVLEELLDTLPEIVTVGGMRAAVYEAIDGVAAILKPINSYRPISIALGEAKVVFLVRATRSGAEVYRNRDLLTYSQVKEFANERLELSNRRVQGEMQSEYYLMKAYVDNGEMETLKQELQLVSANIALALSKCGVSSDDALYASINDFVLSVQAYSETINADSQADAVASELYTLFCTTASDQMAQALSVQAYHLAMNRHVNDRLRDVFGLPARDEDLEDEFNDGYEYEQGGDITNPGGDSPDDDDPFEGSGNQYGSDDLIYDPDMGEYVKYGDLLARYYAIAQEYLREGKLTPEQEAQARAYFEILFGGFTESEE